MWNQSHLQDTFSAKCCVLRTISTLAEKVCILLLKNGCSARPGKEGHSAQPRLSGSCTLPNQSTLVLDSPPQQRFKEAGVGTAWRGLRIRWNVCANQKRSGFPENVCRFTFPRKCFRKPQKVHASSKMFAQAKMVRAFQKMFARTKKGSRIRWNVCADQKVYASQKMLVQNKKIALPRKCLRKLKKVHA